MVFIILGYFLTPFAGIFGRDWFGWLVVWTVISLTFYCAAMAGLI